MWVLEVTGQRPSQVFLPRLLDKVYCRHSQNQHLSNLLSPSPLLQDQGSPLHWGLNYLVNQSMIQGRKSPKKYWSRLIYEVLCVLYYYLYYLLLEHGSVLFYFWLHVCLVWLDVSGPCWQRATAWLEYLSISWSFLLQLVHMSDIDGNEAQIKYLLFVHWITVHECSFGVVF